MPNPDPAPFSSVAQALWDTGTDPLKAWEAKLHDSTASARERLFAAERILRELAPAVDVGIAFNSDLSKTVGEGRLKALSVAAAMLEKAAAKETTVSQKVELLIDGAKGEDRRRLILEISRELKEALANYKEPPEVLSGEDEWLRKDLPPRLIWNTIRSGKADNRGERLWEYPPPGIVHSEHITVLAGAGGTGKSRIALQLALTMATEGAESERDDICGMTVATGTVAYLTFEDKPERMHYVRKRLMADMEIKAPPKRLYVVDMGGRSMFGPPEGVLGNASTMEPVRSRHWEPVWKAIKKIKPRLIILDNVGYAFSTPNATTEMVRKFIKAVEEEMQEIGCGMLLVSHTSKDSRKQGRTDPIGSSAWIDASRGVIGVAKTGEKDAFRGIIMRAEKSNYGPDDWEVGLVPANEQNDRGGAWRALPSEVAFPTAETLEANTKSHENAMARKYGGTPPWPEQERHVVPEKDIPF